jgi:hypothetical protein
MGKHASEMMEASATVATIVFFILPIPSEALDLTQCARHSRPPAQNLDPVEIEHAIIRFCANYRAARNIVKQFLPHPAVAQLAVALLLG